MAELRPDPRAAACTTLESPNGDDSDASQVSHQGESVSLALVCVHVVRQWNGLYPSHPLRPPAFATFSTFVAPAGWTSDGPLSSPAAELCLQPSTTHKASVSPGRRPRRPSSSSSPLVYSILVEDKQVGDL